MKSTNTSFASSQRLSHANGPRCAIHGAGALHVLTPHAQTFDKLQQQLIDARSAVKIAEVQLNGKEVENKKNTLTHANIVPLPDSTRMFESVGRMYARALLLRASHRRQVHSAVESRCCQRADQVCRAERSRYRGTQGNDLITTHDPLDCD